MTRLCEMAGIDGWIQDLHVYITIYNLVLLDELLVIERTGHWSTQGVRS